MPFGTTCISPSPPNGCRSRRWQSPSAWQRRLGTPAARNARDAVRAITLPPGISASAALQIADTDGFPSGTCRATTAAGLRVYPPNEAASKVVPYPFRASSRPGPTYLQVATVTKATRP
jgi:Domain of unknown function (DUF4232)